MNEEDQGEIATLINYQVLQVANTTSKSSTVEFVKVKREAT